jgi:hypothetical protein
MRIKPIMDTGSGYETYYPGLQNDLVFIADANPAKMMEDNFYFTRIARTCYFHYTHFMTVRGSWENRCF